MRLSPTKKDALRYLQRNGCAFAERRQLRGGRTTWTLLGDASAFFARTFRALHLEGLVWYSQVGIRGRGTVLRTVRIELTTSGQAWAAKVLEGAVQL
jgi:hypothetical protein